MKRLSKERENRYKRMYYKSNCVSVNDYYKSCSIYKKNAELGVISEMLNNDGFCYKVLNGNSNTFVCAYIMIDIENGNELLIVHTAYNRYVIEL